jgi:hypothetical protein
LRTIPQGRFSTAITRKKRLTAAAFFSSLFGGLPDSFFSRSGLNASETKPHKHTAKHQGTYLEEPETASVAVGVPNVKRKESK